jgi:branched-chain amino acid transport system substrate-binding protein
VVSGVWWSAELGKKPGLAKAFVERFTSKYGGRKPEWFQALAYESARALFTAIEQAGSLDREAVRAKLASLKMPSMLPGGTLEFPGDQGQQAQNPFVLQQNLADTSSPIIFPPDAATGTGIAANPRCPK